MEFRRANDDDEEPLLNNTITETGEEMITSDRVVEGRVNYRGGKINNHHEFGGWKSASRVIVIDIVDAFTFYGIASNLISFLTMELNQSTATAALNVNVWVGFVQLFPLLVGFVADSYLGRFRTIVVSALIYILGLGLLPVSVALLPGLKSADCVNNLDAGSSTSCTSASSFQVLFFFGSLYLVAVGSAGYMTCAAAFGADQFDEQNSNESKSKGSFFNWWQIGTSVGATTSHLTLNYIQDNLGWGLGFGISCISMIVALTVLMFGIKSYRYYVKSEDEEGPVLGLTDVLVAVAKNLRSRFPSSTLIQEEAMEIIPLHITRKQAKVEDTNAILRLLPVWFICLTYAIVIAQHMTFFTKQGSTMDRSLGGSNFQIPSATIQISISISIILFTAVYDRLFVPFARTITGKPNGITYLQRIGGGIFFSAVSMVAAAIVEKRRLQIVLDFGLIDKPEITVPMSVWWLLPQYVLIGLAILLTIPGLQEFFYDQMPDGLRSVGISLFCSMFGVGSVLSGFFISFIQKVTSAGGKHGWFSDNLNRANLDYFYWLLAGFSAGELIAFLYFSKSYVYKSSHSV
ncbi:hypothetical protein MKX01_007038 [Papaver californicum]|nr:hypothetical protein MKX01_007038 [Papaver californicum]